MIDELALQNHPVIFQLPRRVTRGLAGYQQAAFLSLVVSLQRPRSILEIGTRDGDIYCALCQTVQTLALPTTCRGARSLADVAPLGSTAQDPFTPQLRQHHHRHYTDFSTLAESLDVASFGVGTIDLLSITGVLDFEVALGALEFCKPQLSDNAVIIFDGTRLEPSASGVARLWREVANTGPAQEFTLGEGLGLLAPSGNTPVDLSGLFAQSKDDWGALEHFISLLGECTKEAAQRSLEPGLPRLTSATTGPATGAVQADEVRDALIARLVAHDAVCARDLFRKSRELDGLHQATATAQQNVADVVGSISWRVTEPLRRLKRHARKVAGGRGEPRGFASRGPARPYDEWVLRFDTLTDNDRRLMRVDIAAMAHRPTFSIVMPVYDVAAKYLENAIESVLGQIYPHWELCIADDASPSPHVRAMLDRYAAQDRRIRVVYRETNGHISAASNTALALAGGDYVALLDHDDELAEHALYTAAKEFLAHPDTQIIYTDEDRLDEDGRRFGPHFKPDFNPELLYGQNYVTHLCVYRRSLLETIGGFREGLEGSQDYDLLLRAIAQCAASEIRHIPRVLYHWRVIPGSVAHSLDAKPYAAEAGRRAVEDHLREQDPRAEVTEGASPVIYRPRFPLPEPRPFVSIIIPTRNGLSLLRSCISSILEKTLYEPFEVVVIDNASEDPATLAYLTELDHHPRCHVLRYDAPFNYAAMNNFAVQQVNGEYVLLLNNDIEVITPTWLDEMVMWGSRPGIGTVGAKLLYEDDTIQHGGIIMGVGGIAGHGHRHVPRNQLGYFGRLEIAHQVGGNTGACLLVQRSVYLSHGGLDEKNLAVSYNDVDFCLRLTQAGLRHLWTPHAVLYHYESKSRGSDESPANRLRARTEREYMQWRWHDELKREDPAYSPNLTINGEDFALAFPPRVPSISRVAEGTLPNA